MIKEYQTGDSVRFSVTFIGMDSGEVTDPNPVIFRILDSEKNEVFSKELDSNYSPSTGVYQCNYIFDTEGKFCYEFSGVIEGNVSLRRDAVKIVFCK